MLVTGAYRVRQFVIHAQLAITLDFWPRRVQSVNRVLTHQQIVAHALYVRKVCMLQLLDPHSALIALRGHILPIFRQPVSHVRWVPILRSVPITARYVRLANTRHLVGLHAITAKQEHMQPSQAHLRARLALRVGIAVMVLKAVLKADMDISLHFTMAGWRLSEHRHNTIVLLVTIPILELRHV